MSSKSKTAATKEEARPALVPKLRFPEFRGAEGWSEEKLDDLVHFQDGFAFKSTAFVKASEDATQVIRITDINNKNINEDKVYIPTAFLERNNLVKYGVEDGDLLLSLTGAAGFNFFFWNGGPATINQRTAKVTSKRKDGHALLRLLEPLIHEKLNERGEGQNNNLSKEFLNTIVLLVPEPAEQQKIAECLSSVDELMAAQARKVETLKTHKKGLMQQLFPREGETQPRLRFPEFQNAGEWEAKKLGQIAKYTKGFAFKSEDYKSQGVRIIRVSDLGTDFIKPNNEKLFISSEAEHEYARYKLTASEIIITTVGSKPELVDSAVGRGIYVTSNNEGLLNQNLLKLEVLPGVNSRFLFSHINTPEYQRFIASISRGNANQANIAVKDLMGFIIKAPSSAEQQRIATCLSSLDALITAETQKYEALKTQKKGLMQQLFPSPKEVEA